MAYKIEELNTESTGLIQQTLTDHVKKSINHHIDHSGQGITEFSHKIGIQSIRIQAFLKGASSFRLDTADKILKYIHQYKKP
jgi:predicted transcriptional regulator